MSKRLIASEILKSLPPHIQQDALRRLSWVQAYWSATSKAPTRARGKVLEELLAARKAKGKAVPGQHAVERWEKDFREFGFAGLAGRVWRRRLSVDRLRDPSEIANMDLVAVADLLSAIVDRMRSMTLPKPEQAKPDTGGPAWSGGRRPMAHGPVQQAGGAGQ